MGRKLHHFVLASMHKILERFLFPIIKAYQAKRKAEIEVNTKRKFGYCGEGVSLSGSSNFISPSSIKIGNNVHVGKNAWFRADGGLEIGDNTIISRNCVIFTASHNYKGERLPYDDTFLKAPVYIGRNVWIGMNVMITPGVTIGDGAIIGLGTVVVKDVPPLAIVGGYGQRVLKYRDRAHYERLDQQGLYISRGEKPLDK
jgi:maltose O-acetyltransferase